jgi:activating signal cointegrator complex subunit 3
VATGELGAGEKLVQICDLELWMQSAFLPFGITQLNRIQSRIFRTATYSNENVLVCAPTGAGKTNIAMLCVLREVGLHRDVDDDFSPGSGSGYIDLSAFKIVYVAPMKALAGEVTAAFTKRLSALGLRVKELTGDMQLSRKELEETQMIVTTPEKWDVITDEVHLLNDERGPVIETLVARTLRQVRRREGDEGYEGATTYHDKPQPQG